MALTWRRVAVVGPALGAVGWLLWSAPAALVVGVLVGASALALQELQSLLDAPASYPHGLVSAAGALVTASCAAGEAGLTLGVLALTSTLLCLALLIGSAPVGIAVRASAQALFALLYVAVPLGLLILVRLDARGRLGLALIVGLTWSRDIGAALVGRAVRARPLWPKLSPHKHGWGALGGALGVATVSWAVNATGLAALRRRDAVVLVLLVAVLGQAGDLFESLLKRSAGVRHSGDLFAEQGGLLDCLDGLLFVGPAVWCYLQTLPHKSFW